MMTALKHSPLTNLRVPWIITGNKSEMPKNF